MKSYSDFRCVILILFFISLNPFQPAFGQIGTALQPVSGADGVYETVMMDGKTVYRSVEKNGQFELYMYFRCSRIIKNRTAYLEVTYLDIGYDRFWVQYNSKWQDYENTTTGYDNFVLGTGRERTAVFELTDADFRNAQNLQADLRLANDGSLQMHIVSVTVYLEPTPLYLTFDENWIAPYSGPPYLGEYLVDAATLTGKVICGYQGWFRAAGDPSGAGWVHYVHGDFNDLTVEMWPDMLEYGADEKYPVPGWTHADGKQATLFSSANKRTVLRHFQWMEAYGIDGVAVQRFVSGLSLQHPKESFRIPGYARDAAHRTGRTFFIMYDMSGVSPGNSISLMSNDWAYLIDTMQITEDDRYLHHLGKPVIGLFGFFSNRFNAAEANQILDVFQNESSYAAFVVGSGQWWWRSEAAAGWSAVFQRMDAWIPWNVGNYTGAYARTDIWATDKSAMDASGVVYMPLVYPGFGWDNLQNYPPGTSYKSRLHGDFLWNQFLAAKNIDAQAVYVAMFDEIDESTAIFKVTNDIPVNHYFTDLEGLPSDFYLLLTGLGTKIIRGEVENPSEMPDFSLQSQPSIPDILTPVYGDSLTNDVVVSWNSSKHSTGIIGYALEIDEVITIQVDTFYVVQLDEGEHNVRVRAINGLNNQGGWSVPTTFTVVETPAGIQYSDSKSIGEFSLSQNYPNPFNSKTQIHFTIPKPSFVTLTVYDLKGRRMKRLIHRRLDRGRYTAVFDAAGLPGGLVFYTLQTDVYRRTRKGIYMK